MDSASVPSWSKLNSHLYTHITMATLEASILRGQATRDAQSTIAATWVWEEKTVVQWDGSLTAINTKKVAVSDLEADMLAKRANYENNIVVLHDRTVEGVGLARVKWRKDEGKKKILSGLSAAGGGREVVQKEAQAWESVWEKFDATWVPKPPDNTIANLRTLIGDSDTLENLYKKANTDWRTGEEERHGDREHDPWHHPYQPDDPGTDAARNRDDDARRGWRGGRHLRGHGRPARDGADAAMAHRGRGDGVRA